MLLTIDSCDKFCHPLDTSLDSRLSSNVVILDTIKEARQTPERVGFDGV